MFKLNPFDYTFVLEIVGNVFAALTVASLYTRTAHTHEFRRTDLFGRLRGAENTTTVLISPCSQYTRAVFSFIYSFYSVTTEILNILLISLAGLSSCSLDIFCLASPFANCTITVQPASNELRVGADHLRQCGAVQTVRRNRLGLCSCN